MSARSFSVFRDEPAPSASRTLAAPPFKRASTLPLTTRSMPQTLSPLPTPTIEKENLHPVTGQPSLQPSATASKKRKSSVLATKSIAATVSAKKAKETNEPKPTKRKSRKPSSNTSPVKKEKAKKEKTISTVTAVTRKSTRRKPTLPRVEEVTEGERDHDHELTRQSQIDADSRCYDLTVKSLADVTHAYEQGVRPEADGPAMKGPNPKEVSLEPELRDYFSSSRERNSPGKRSQSRGPSAEPGRTLKEFSTPERKRIYSAFTFTSPSPTIARVGSFDGDDGDDVPRLSFTPFSS